MGRQTEQQSGEDESSRESEDSQEKAAGARSAPKSRMLIPRVNAIGEVPFDVVVNPEQVESALGHAQATEFDDELLDAVDLDLRAEEEALFDLGESTNGEEDMGSRDNDAYSGGDR